MPLSFPRSIHLAVQVSYQQGSASYPLEGAARPHRPDDSENRVGLRAEIQAGPGKMTERTTRTCPIERLPEEIIAMILVKVVELETDEFEFSAGGRLVGTWSPLRTLCMWRH